MITIETSTDDVLRFALQDPESLAAIDGRTDPVLRWPLGPISGMVEKHIRVLTPAG